MLHSMRRRIQKKREMKDRERTKERVKGEGRVLPTITDLHLSSSQ